jgi:hypothetical protein
MSLILSMNHALLMSPDASALLEEDAGKFLLYKDLLEAEDDDS